MTRVASERARKAKRAMDLAVAIPALILLSPILAFCFLLILFTMGPPILLRQQRPGFREKLFTLYKFRTMSEERDVDGALLPDARRLTLTGRFLRSLSLDELPQLLNVLKGDLSLVGPRPLLVEYLERYDARQRRRHEARPGITGWAQVNGRNAITWEQKFEHDLWYVEHWSLGLDVKILLRTLWKTLSMEGIRKPGFATTEEFMGSEKRKP